MTETPSASQTPRPLLANAFIQAALVACAGLLVAVLANHLSPLGLSLTRDYFPAAVPVETPATTSPEPAPTAAPKHEFATATRADVQELLRDPRFVMQKFLLIDARNVANFQAGHIPGALQYDHFRPTENIAQIVPPCLAAEKIIIYCHGGQCQDSIFTSRLLVGYGVPASRIAIYEAGIEDWRHAELPLQTKP
jgi:rhodanese-related sulfurtransferase